MLLILEEPYKSIYKRGYLRLNNQGRQVVDLVIDNDNRTTTSYARYLMSVKLGYIVSDDFEVDHIDNDKTNDDINNLQLLSPLENKIKDTEYRDIFCDCCGKVFSLSIGEVNKRMNSGTSKIFCSRSCNGKFYLNKTNNIAKALSEQDKEKIKLFRQQGLTGKEISLQTGFNRNTVMKYW